MSPLNINSEASFHLSDLNLKQNEAESFFKQN